MAHNYTVFTKIKVVLYLNFDKKLTNNKLLNEINKIE